jgi:hypothetical protein
MLHTYSSYDIQESNSFVLQEQVSPGRVNYHWMKCSSVRDIQATGLSQMTSESTNLQAIDIRTLETRITHATHIFASNKASFGVGVSRDAQEIFDSLAKTMPCYWSGDVINCYSVRITPPYTSRDCEGTDENELSRVRKVLDGERAKLDKKRQIRD